MKQELINALEGKRVMIGDSSYNYVDDLEHDDDEELDWFEYIIRDGKFYFNGGLYEEEEPLLDLQDIDDSNWEAERGFDLNEDVEIQYWAILFIKELLKSIMYENLTGFVLITDLYEEGKYIWTMIMSEDNDLEWEHNAIYEDLD